MKQSHNFALFNCESLQKPLKKEANDLFLVSNLVGLHRVIVHNEIDLIIFEEGDLTKKQAQELFVQYGVPFLQIVRKKAKKLKEEDNSIFYSLGGEIIDDLNQFREVINILKVTRENRSLKKMANIVREFDTSVEHVARDFFINEVKKYFKSILYTQKSVWIELPESLGKLPPILKLKQHLSSQNVDQSDLVADLEDCEEELISRPRYQVWRCRSGKIMAFLWMDVGYQHSQCLLLNGIQFHSLKELQNWLHYLAPMINRRWNICSAIEVAQEQVYRDSLTDLYNQKFLTEVLNKKIEEYRRYKTPFSVLFIDVDHFKKVNDGMGHVVGSSVLREMGTLLENMIRESDYAFRYGGDEFILLLSHTEGADAESVAERIRAKVEAQTFHVNGVDVNITISIGLAFYPQHAQSAEDIVRIADEAMYYGKNKSRNIVYTAS
ncbi:MAG: GGDEF domain-containing protein [Bdellovibrionales bacterium]|nr:GGDEF domain-containing protein [Bdellovibrionales bacterium]